MYSLVRPLLFAIEGEAAHKLALTSLDALHRVGAGGLLAPRLPALAKTVMGLSFPNPVGLAAGLDKDGRYIDALAALGFGFLEGGTVTPRPQPGNDKPRMFRIPEADALINRMGFNNGGVEALVRNVERARFDGVLGINIGKNFDTPIARAADDYRTCLAAVYPLASYVTVNISSPNTQNLRQLQQAEELDALLTEIGNERDRLAARYQRRVPLAVKIAPDLDDAQIEAIADLLIRHGIDGVLATNTTLSKDAVADLPHGQEAGGLSGAPLREASNRVIRLLFQALHGRIPIIGIGGISSVEHAQQKFDAGASLVQVYTGLIYRGPGLVAELVRGLAARR